MGQEFDPLVSSAGYDDQNEDDILDDISSLGQGSAIGADDQNLQPGVQDEDPLEEEDEEF